MKTPSNNQIFAVVSSFILGDEKLNARQMLLLGIISSLQTEGFCYTSNKTLAKLLNCTERVIKKDLEYLEELRMLNITHNEIVNGQMYYQVIRLK